MDYDLIDKLWLLLVLVWVGIALTPKHVVVAWLIYFSLRRHPAMQRQSVRRWLWIKTLRRANGLDWEED